MFFVFLIYLFYLFIFGCIGSSLLCTGCLLLWHVGATLRWSEWASHCGGLSLQSTGYRCSGLSSCSTRAHQLWLVDPRVQAQQLWCMGPVAPPHVGSSWTRDRPMSPALAGGSLTTAPTGKPDHMVFILQFVNMVYHIDWFLYIEESLHSWDKPHLMWYMILFICFGFCLLVFCWGFLHLCSSVILVCNFLSLWHLCLVLVSGWWWPRRMRFGVFLLLLYFRRVWEGWVLALL